MAEKTKNDEELINILKIIAPGTLFREGLDNILKAKTGALIIIGDTKEVLDLVDGGFRIDEEYTPARLYELAKMDGAIVLSKDLKRILLANTQIIPSPKILTQETGTRHRTAERTAKQTGELVVSISQRRNIITVFKGDFRYTIEDSSKIVTKANQALQTLENYKRVFDTKLRVLNEYEFNDIVTLDNVITCIQRAEMVNRVAEQVKRSVAVYPRGYRILNKIPRMPNSIVTNLVKTFKSFQHILLADVDKLDEVEGIGEVRARTIKQSLRRMQEQFVFDNLMI